MPSVVEFTLVTTGIGGGDQIQYIEHRAVLPDVCVLIDSFCFEGYILCLSATRTMVPIRTLTPNNACLLYNIIPFWNYVSWQSWYRTSTISYMKTYVQRVVSFLCIGLDFRLISVFNNKKRSWEYRTNYK